MPLHDYHVYDPFTLGIEMELQVVNPTGDELSQDASKMIAVLKGENKNGETKNDIPESTLEVVNYICSDIH